MSTFYSLEGGRFSKAAFALDSLVKFFDDRLDLLPCSNKIGKVKMVLVSKVILSL